jgi:hypothetical protein
VIDLDPTTATIPFGTGIERVGRVTDDGPGPLSGTIDVGGGPRPLELTELAQLTAATAQEGAPRRMAAGFVARSTGMALGGHGVTVVVCDAAGACSSAGFAVEVVDLDGQIPATTLPPPVAVGGSGATTPPLVPTVPTGGLPATGGDPVRTLSVALLGLAAGGICLALARRRHDQRQSSR